MCKSRWPSSGRRAITEPGRYKIPTHTSAHCNRNFEHNDMESSSTNFDNSFYEVRASFIYLLCCCPQSLVSVWAVLYRSRGHLPPERPSITTTLGSTRLRLPIRISQESAGRAIYSRDYTKLLLYSPLRPRPAGPFTSNRHPCQ